MLLLFDLYLHYFIVSNVLEVYQNLKQHKQNLPFKLPNIAKIITF